MKTTVRSAISSFILCVLTAAANAGTVQLVGDTITYEYDDSINAAALALFGTPEIQGDVVRFLPPDFIAQSIDGGVDTVGATFVFSNIFSNNGMAITDITITEFGDYNIVNEGEVTLDLDILATNNNDTSETISDGAFLLYAGDSGPGLTQWMTTVALFPSLAFSESNSIQLEIENILSAFTNGAGDTAFIQKKFGIVASTAVPLPAAAWLLASAFGFFGVLRRRRR